MPDGYNSRIYREQGGSKLTVASGASVQYAGGAEASMVSGALRVGDLTFHAGRDAPTLTASPGSIYLRSDGSVSQVYSNISSGESGSVWASMSQLS